jgi:cardiolipin synthase
MHFDLQILEDSLLRHLLTVGGFLLAFVLIARLLGEKRQPGNTMAWLLVIALVPYVGVPLYLLIGGRKLKRLAARKAPLCPVLPDAPVLPAAGGDTAQALTFNGACPPVGGNTVHFVTTGEQAFAELEKHIRSAKESIHIMTFILGRDEVGRRLVELLTERARAGVKVRLLLDAVGCFLSSRWFCDRLRAAGGEVVRFMPVLPLTTRSSANLRNHRKIAIFDQRTAMLGGYNVAIEYMGPKPYRKRWRDFGAVVTGPAVGVLSEIFLADWSYASRQPIDRLHRIIPMAPSSAHGAGELQVVASGPDIEGDPLYEGIISLIQEAEHRICIITPYFIPDEVLFRSLLVKARSGKEVKLLIPARSNHPVTDLARASYLRELQKAGVHVLLFQPGMLHAKAMIIDDRIGLMGSANFDLRSLFVNFEVGLFVYSKTEVQAMTAWATELIAHSRPLGAAGKQKRGWLRSSAEDLCRLLAPLL